MNESLLSRPTRALTAIDPLSLGECRTTGHALIVRAHIASDSSLVTFAGSESRTTRVTAISATAIEGVANVH